MTEFFLTVINMSISASWIVLAVLLLRLVLKKAPKWITVLLWGIVAVRLICPFSFESALSLIPSAETISPQVLVEEPEINTGISFINSTINPIIQESTITFEPEKSVNTMKLVVQLSSMVWIVGVAVMLVYTFISYWRVKRKIGTAVLFRDNIFQSENVVSPFVLGIIKPKIYLPFQINEQDMTHVIAHENAHIRRKDHWWKPFGFLLLSIHWFNPFVWLGYILLCRDIELACDEKVIKEMDTEQKADYSQALLTCSVNRRMIAACPLAFGEVSVKNRVKSVLNYKKPAFWIIIIAIVISLVVGVCFLTNPTSTDLNPEMSAFIEEQILEHHFGMYKSGEFCCTDFEVLGTQKKLNYTTVYMWVLYEEYTDDNGKIEDVSGGHIPTAITLRKSNGQYELVEYWGAEDGTRYVPSIRAKFPLYLWWKATDSQRYIEKQHQSCYRKACEYFISTSDVGGADGPENVTILETTVSYANCSNTNWIFAGALNNEKMYISSVQHLPIYKFDTLEDLQQFKKHFENHHSLDQDYDEASSFNDSTANYDDAFFAENSLLLVYMAGSSSLQLGVRNAIYNDNALCVYIEETTKTVLYTADMRGRFITLAVPDEQIKNCTEFDAVFYHDSEENIPEDEENVTESVIRCPYTVMYEQTPTEDIKAVSAKEEFVYTKMHYQTIDGKWHSEGRDYLYRLEITGRMNNAAKNTTYVVLCNESITFDQAWKAAGFSSNSEDYFDPADAIIVGYRNFSDQAKDDPEETEPPATTPDNSNSSNYRLIVAGRDITQGNYINVSNITENSCSIYLPFTAIAKCYGVKVNWTSNTVAELTFNGNTYFLDLSNVSLVKKGGNSNYLIPAPGSSMYTQVMGKELILDGVTLRSVLMFMGINTQVRVDHQSKTVTIQ